MARVVFTPNLQRHVESPAEHVEGRTVCEVLGAVFASNPRLRGYVLDDQGSVRPHMVVFVNGEQIKDRRGLTDAVPDGAEVYVMQALSGG